MIQGKQTRKMNAMRKMNDTTKNTRKTNDKTNNRREMNDTTKWH